MPGYVPRADTPSSDAVAASTSRRLANGGSLPASLVLQDPRLVEASAAVQLLLSCCEEEDDGHLTKGGRVGRAED